MHAITKHRTVRLLTVAVLLGSAIQVAACSDGGGGSIFSPPPPTPPVQPVGAARFGGGFATSFAANKDTDPRDPVAGDIISVSFTTDPLDVP